MLFVAPSSMHCRGMVHERKLIAQAREHMTNPNPEPELLELVPPPTNARQRT